MAANPWPDLPGGRSLAGTDADAWDQLRQWAEAETGMDFAAGRLPRLQEAVRKALAQQPGASLNRLLAHPREHGAFWERLTAELTVGESYFFRNEHHFRALREHVVPQILQENADRREIRVWSAGCAGGEEPYSLAILLDQMLAARRDWRISILATDLNPEFLERARQGRFRAWSFRQTSIHTDPACFVRQGEFFRLADRIRERVRFAYLNLVKDVYPSPLTGTLGLDLILFRNVAIYLKAEVTVAILDRFRQALRPGGWLLLGETEVASTPAVNFEVRRYDRATLFQKPHAAPTPLGPTPGSLAACFRGPQPVLAQVAWAPSAAQADRPSLRGRPAVAAPCATGREPREDALAQPAQHSWDRIERWAVERRFEEAERALARLADRQQRAELRLRYSQLLLRVAEPARSRRMLELCLADEPLLLEAQLLSASFAEEAGDWQAAAAAYRRALYIDRHCPMAHFHLALVQNQQRDRTGAARSLRTMLNLIAGKDPHALAPYGEGVCYGRLAEMANVLLAAVARPASGEPTAAIP